MRTLAERQILAAASEIKRAERKQAVKARVKPVVPIAKGQRRPRVRDKDYLHWLHRWPCIACIVTHPDPMCAWPIEAAHQKHVDGRGASLGKRPSDSASCPLCAWHHRLAPDCCDPAQSKFWDRLGVDVKAFCAALYACFQADGDGAAVVRDFAKSRVGSV